MEMIVGSICSLILFTMITFLQCCMWPSNLELIYHIVVPAAHSDLKSGLASGPVESYLHVAFNGRQSEKSYVVPMVLFVTLVGKVVRVVGLSTTIFETWNGAV